LVFVESLSIPTLILLSQEVTKEEGNADAVHSGFDELSKAVSRFHTDVVEKAIKQAQSSRPARLREVSARIIEVEDDLEKYVIIPLYHSFRSFSLLGSKNWFVTVEHRLRTI
jgi:hypothetical protein